MIDITNHTKEEIVEYYELALTKIQRNFEEETAVLVDRIEQNREYYQEKAKHYRDIVIKIIDYSSHDMLRSSGSSNVKKSISQAFVIKSISQALTPVAYHSIKGNFTEEEYKLIAEQILVFIEKAEAFERLLDAIAKNEEVSELWSQLVMLAKLTDTT